MKKLLILLFSILISFNSYGGLFDKTVCVDTEVQLRGDTVYLPNKDKPFTGKNLCKYENGQNKSKGEIKDGKLDGKWTYWHKNGQIKKEMWWDGIFNRSTEYQYNNSGQIESKENYIYDKLTSSTLYEYHLNGNIQSESSFKDGIEDGKEIWWYENGQIELEFNYKEGVPIGTSIGWYKSGKKEFEESYKNGVFSSGTTWYENGQKKSEQNWTDWEKNNGKKTLWNENGQIVAEAIYKDGECISEDCD